MPSSLDQSLWCFSMLRWMRPSTSACVFVALCCVSVLQRPTRSCMASSASQRRPLMERQHALTTFESGSTGTFMNTLASMPGQTKSFSVRGQHFSSSREKIPCQRDHGCKWSGQLREVHCSLVNPVFPAGSDWQTQLLGKRPCVGWCKRGRKATRKVHVAWWWRWCQHWKPFWCFLCNGRAFWVFCCKLLPLEDIDGKKIAAAEKIVLLAATEVETNGIKEENNKKLLCHTSGSSSVVSQVATAGCMKKWLQFLSKKSIHFWQSPNLKFLAVVWRRSAQLC